MTVILVVHILVCLVLVGVVLMQRSEGGALGIGGGGGGGLMSGRGAAGALVRTTIIFGGIFFVTSLVLTTIATRHLGDDRTGVERALDEELGVGAPSRDPLDVINDPTAPLLDDGPSTGTSEPSAVPPSTGATGSEDPLSVDVTEPETTEEPVEENQPQ